MISEISCEIGYNIYKEGGSMAILSMFYGIIISMYYMDNRQHHVPHIHVTYQGQEAVISIPDGELLEGENIYKIDPSVLKLLLLKITLSMLTAS